MPNTGQHADADAVAEALLGQTQLSLKFTPMFLGRNLYPMKVTKKGSDNNIFEGLFYLV